jgi:uncharacterized membrane protein YphA (DoxX/SURF4 family)
LFQRLLAVIFLIAWASLGVQVLELIGSRGLLPARPFLAAARDNGIGFGQLPTLFWLDVSDTILVAGVWVGAGLALCALVGLYPRWCFALSTLLYLSYATVARTFLSFQWDNLLLECGALAVFLPTDRSRRWIHVLFRVLLLKLYWESGLAKWQSHLGDWQDGSAMTYYFETAPLPTWLAWYAHALPLRWHHFESWTVLILELVLPVAIFGPRSARLLAAFVFTAFQIANIATANYGFFAYSSIALNVFLLADRDLKRLPRWLGGGLRVAPRVVPPAGWTRWWRAAGAALVVTVYVGVSAVDAWSKFARPPSSWMPAIETASAVWSPWRLINTYHLFGHITRDRIEPEFQTFDGSEWYPLALHHKPGDPTRAPSFVAPHQPRLDFQLWFYGLGFRRGTPGYVAATADRLCNDPVAVRRLFETPLPVAPQAVRIVFWQYRFTTPEERRSSGAWWKRTEVASSRAHSCR